MNSSSRPGHPFKIHPSDLKEATEATHSSSSNKVNMKEKKAFGLRMKKDLKGSCQTTVRRHSGSLRRTMRSSQEKCQGGISDSRREKEKENQETKRAVTNEVALNPSEKAVLAGMANENYDPYDQAYWGKGKGKKGKKENQNSNIPMMETKVIHLMRMAKERADMTKENPRRSQPPQKRRRSSPP